MPQVVDYSFARPNLADLAAWGYVGLMRYLAKLPNAKVITAEELDQAHRVGLAVGFVWEVGVDWTTWNGAEADRQLAALGVPDAVPVYWAVDRDVAPRDYGFVGQMLDGVSSRRPRGIYGGSGLVEACIAGGHARFGWIAAATSWGHGQPAPSAHLRQLVGGAPRGCDVNDVLQSNWGQWSPGSTPSPDLGDDDMAPAMQYQIPDGRIFAIPRNGARPWHIKGPDVQVLLVLSGVLEGEVKTVSDPDQAAQLVASAAGDGAGGGGPQGDVHGDVTLHFT